jgi:hypothetical protein
MRLIAAATCAVGLFSVPSSAGEYLDHYETQVFEAQGDHQAIAKRAVTCITQIVRPGLINAPTITSSDLESGTIVANNGFSYSFGLLGGVERTARSTMTFQAKDGRFRITHTNIEQFASGQWGGNRWEPIFVAWGTGGKEARDALYQISSKVASCVTVAPAANDNW